MDKKKKSILILTILMVVSLACVSTFLVRENQFNNVITFGNLKMEINRKDKKYM